MSNAWDQRLIYYQYFEDFLAGKRVLEVGCGEGQGAAFLLGRAASVVCLDRDTEGLERCRERLESGILTFGEVDDAFPVQGGAVDMALVPELGPWADWAPLVQEVRRVLAPGGVAMFACANGDDDPEAGLAFAELDAMLSPRFDGVRMMGLISFLGQTVADFAPADGDLEPVLDCSLVEHDPSPSHYVALCGAEALPPQPYTVLQVPSRGEAGAATGGGGLLQQPPGLLAPAPQDHRDRGADLALAEAQSSARQNARRAESAERRCDSLMDRMEQGATELARLHQRIAEIQGLRQADQWRLDELTSLVRQFEEQADTEGSPEQARRQLEVQLEQAEARAAEQSRRATNAQAGKAQADAARARAEAELKRVTGELERLKKELDRQGGGPTF